MSSCEHDDLDRYFIGIDKYIRGNDDQDMDEIIRRLAKLQALAIVKTNLVLAARNLTGPHEGALPNQLATRVKHIIKFAFGESKRNEKRSALVRGLECNALKFCGLAYTIRDLLGMPELQFELLIDYVADFVRDRELAQHLYRNDINKVFNNDMVAENALLYQDFLIASVQARPIRGTTTVPSKEIILLSQAPQAPDTNEPAEALSAMSNDLHDQILRDVRPHKRKRENGADDTSAPVEPVTAISTLRSEKEILRHVSPEWSLSGDVFKLSINDFREIACSDQVGSDISLTWPLVLQTAPFVTAPVSNALALRFASRCSYLK